MYFPVQAAVQKNESQMMFCSFVKLVKQNLHQKF